MGHKSKMVEKKIEFLFAFYLSFGDVLCVLNHLKAYLEKLLKISVKDFSSLFLLSNLVAILQLLIQYLVKLFSCILLRQIHHHLVYQQPHLACCEFLRTVFYTASQNLLYVMW